MFGIMTKSSAKVRSVRIHKRTDSALRFERRGCDREPSSGLVAATYSNGGDRFGLTHLELLDRSSGGMGARTRAWIEPGMTVTICPEGSSIPWLTATAVRCEDDGDQYRVGLCYSHRAAA
jgi:hypothetical protein